MSAFDAMTGLHFLRPWWLLGLLALPLLAWAWRARHRRRSVWRDAVDPHLLPHLLEGAGAERGRRAPWAGLLALALATLALAGPSWRQAEQPLWQSRAPLIVALDLSSATSASDLPPSRLLQARAKIAALLKARAGGQVGLVAYAADAYTVAPLTDDVANVALFLDALTPDVMPEDGSDPGRAIAWSARLLRQAGFDRGDIVLLTNAADGAARRAARQAAGDGYRVSVLGLGSAAGAAYRKDDGGIARTRLEADGLRALAGAGGGAYAQVSEGDADLRALDVLDPRAAGALAERGEKGGVPLDEGYWLLPPLLLLGALAFRRGGALAALLLCLWLPLPPARAQAADGGRSESTLWRRADQRDHARMQQGAQAYRKRDFAAASQAYAGVDSADGAYNLGNALAKQGRYEDAIAAYDRALRMRSGMEDAVANRRAVQAAMRRKPPPGKHGQRNQPQPSGKPRSGGQGDPQPGDGDGKPQPAQPPKAGGQRDAQRKDGQPPPQTDPAGDADAQRAADRAQRQRMQQALQKGRQQAGDGQEEKGKPDRAESAADRERSIANEAWLRRVPDDPGGLLRAKFQLEYERRQAEGDGP